MKFAADFFYVWNISAVDIPLLWRHLATKVLNV